MNIILDSAWYKAKRSQRYEVAEGLRMASKIAEGVLYDGKANQTTSD